MLWWWRKLRLSFAIRGRRNIKGSAESFATQFEEPSREIYRYRAAIVQLMQLKPGMTAAEVGAGSGFLARFMVTRLARTGG